MVAIRRSQLFKAHGELSTIRRMAIVEACRTIGVTQDCERRIDELKGPLSAQLRASFPRDPSAAELLRALTCAISALLEAHEVNGADVTAARDATTALLAM